MLDVVLFEDPDVLAEFGGVSVFSVAEWMHRKTRKLTKLSKHIWTLKDNNIEHLGLFPGAFSHHTCRTTAQVKDVISASKKKNS